MKIPAHPTLIQRALDARLKQLQAQGPVLAASLVTLHRTCASPPAAVPGATNTLASTSPGKKRAKLAAPMCPRPCSPKSNHGKPNTAASNACSRKSLN